MVNIKTRILATLTLVFITTLIINNFIISITQPLKNEVIKNKIEKNIKQTKKFCKKVIKSENKKATKSVSEKMVTNKPKKEPIYIAQNDVKITDAHHHATWYRTEGTRVHREHPTAAYNFTPRGTKLLVINALSGDSCIVEVTDRMGYAIPNRIDLSHSAFGKIAKHSGGVAKVIVKILE